jgi:hypothetical protein
MLPSGSSWDVPHKEKLQGNLVGFLTVNIKGEPQPSYLLWTHRGVLVRREELPALGSVGVSLLICGDELSTHRCGLLLTEGPYYQRQREEALMMARKALFELEEESTQLMVVLKRSDSFYAQVWSKFTSWEADDRIYLEQETKLARAGLRQLAAGWWGS